MWCFREVSGFVFRKEIGSRLSFGRVEGVVRFRRDLSCFKMG